jgi:hypothetical protein
LSAAFAPNTADTPTTPATMGALDSDDLALATLDGADAERPGRISVHPSSSFGPPNDALPASIGPAVAVAAEPASASALNVFAPPDESEAPLEVEIAADERPRRRGQTPPAGAATVAAASGVTTPVLQKRAPRPSAGPADSARGVVVRDGSRARFAIGVLGAVIIGFIPAHIVASIREGSYDRVDDHVRSVQAQLGTVNAPVAYAQLDEFRADQLARKLADRRNIALLGLAVWGIAGAAFGYVWFKRIRPV